MIDEKGRLFGKINIVDLLIVLVVIAALCFVVFRYVLPQKDSGDIEKRELVLYCHDTPKFTARQIKEGAKVWDQALDVDLGTVKSFEIMPLYDTVAGPDGKIHQVESDWLCSVRLVLDSDGVMEDHGIKIGGELYGSGHTMTVFAGEAKMYLKVEEIR